MFNIGFTELILLGIIALIFVGPDQLPELARSVARMINELKRASSDLQQTLTSDLTTDVQQRIETVRQEQAAVDATAPEAAAAEPTAPTTDAPTDTPALPVTDEVKRDS